MMVFEGLVSTNCNAWGNMDSLEAGRPEQIKHSFLNY